MGWESSGLSSWRPGDPVHWGPLILKGLFFQDKYLADMDELFSQVDERRKVSMPQRALLSLPIWSCLL